MAKFSCSIWTQIKESERGKKCGLASAFSVLDNSKVCGAENVVKTSSERRSGQRSPLSHYFNSRAVLGCLHSEVGETHLNNLLCTLNISSMNL